MYKCFRLILELSNVQLWVLLLMNKSETCLRLDQTPHKLCHSLIIMFKVAVAYIYFCTAK